MSVEPDSRAYGRFDELAQEFAERYRRGERPSLDEYVKLLPEMADDIREMFPALVEIERVQADAQNDALQQTAVPFLKELGDYRIVREIGRGGMGVVYEADQVSLGRRVALKVLPGRVVSDRSALERFRREAKAAARLHHTNIVPVFEVGQEGDVAFYAMRFIQGQGLDQVILELGRLRFPGRNPIGKDDARNRFESQTRPARGVSIAAAASTSNWQLRHAVESLLTGRQGTEWLNSSIDRASAATEAALAEPLDPAAKSGLIARNAASSFPPTGSEATGSRSAVLPGGTVLSMVETSSGRQPFFRSVGQIGRQAAQGLAYAHSRGIIHRDIKPSNRFLRCRHGPPLSKTWRSTRPVDGWRSPAPTRTLDSGI